MDKKRLSNEEIIAALISCGSIKEAASMLGYTVRTVYERMKAPDFRDQYAQAKGEIVKAAAAKLQGHMCDAVDTLVHIMTDTQAGNQTRVNCATAILQYGARYTEATDILERLEVIEQAQAVENTL